jgi:hypothetical protein
MHYEDIERHGTEYCRRLIETNRNLYEMDLEKRAFGHLQDFFGNNLPEETLRIHSDLIRLLSRS